jgi:hypothetical protein
VELAITILALVLFDIAALRWGADSRDSINSSEWERRRIWSNHH